MQKWLGIFIAFTVTILFIYGSEQHANAAQTNVQKATVAVSVLNVRNGPSLKNSVIAQVSYGQTFQILDQRYGWLKISLQGDQNGWIAQQFTDQSGTKVSAKHRSSSNENSKPTVETSSSITTLYNGTHLRSGPGTNYPIVSQASQGDKFTVLGEKNDWYHIDLPNGTDAYVAGWIVVASKKEQSALSGKTLVIDPGHGGKDTGAIGYGNKVLEKNLTLRTAKELAKKLRKAGAHVILTRQNDTFLSLQQRVNIAEQNKADAFISIHYNASLIPSANGVTSYYYTKRKDQPLALAIQQMLAKESGLNSRGVHFANYHVLRKNSRPSTLLELGFLTNEWEEHVVSTSNYQNSVTTAILNGVENYFNGH